MASQAHIRGFVARSKFRRLLAAHRAVLAAEQARKDAAAAVIAPWARTFYARTRFRRQRWSQLTFLCILRCPLQCCSSPCLLADVLATDTGPARLRCTLRSICRICCSSSLAFYIIYYYYII